MGIGKANRIELLGYSFLLLEGEACDVCDHLKHLKLGTRWTSNKDWRSINVELLIEAAPWTIHKINMGNMEWGECNHSALPLQKNRATTREYTHKHTHTKTHTHPATRANNKGGCHLHPRLYGHVGIPQARKARPQDNRKGRTDKVATQSCVRSKMSGEGEIDSPSPVTTRARQKGHTTSTIEHVFLLFLNARNLQDPQIKTCHIDCATKKKSRGGEEFRASQCGHHATGVRGNSAEKEVNRPPMMPTIEYCPN